MSLSVGVLDELESSSNASMTPAGNDSSENYQML
jgi:hypothetical protein